jgi:transitional endoplasmic reticulum ATPase
MGSSLRQRQLARLRELITDLKQGDVLVIPHLDLLAGGSDGNLPTESRELVELVYERSDRLILAFADRSMDLPEVLASRFAVRLLASGVPRMVLCRGDEERPLGEALVTAAEAARFTGFDAHELHKNVAGLNPVQLRHAMAYAVNQHASGDPVPVAELYRDIRAFKAQTSAKFEVPNVSFDHIGGYDDVKAELIRAIQLMGGAYNLPSEELRGELLPRGFLFWGPPGTGKTLFAKAIANRLNATIQVVSGPEVTDMYVGESERKVRELFAEARRNAPAVLVFDEFDSIATQRSGREDGGTRAGNALVAQILTEMDGFRPDVPMLVIGTTNRIDIIDKALLRPSRFKPVAIGLPDGAARRRVADIHARHFGIKLTADMLNVIADATDGFSGDDVRSLFRDACLGQHCQDPPLPIDGYRFGTLIGAFRRATDDQQVAESAQKSTALENVPPGQPPGPSTPMVRRTPTGDASEPESSRSSGPETRGNTEEPDNGMAEEST